MLDSRRLWRNYRMRRKWKSSQPWLSESIVTQPWVKPHTGTGCWRHKRRFETSLRFIIVLFANLGDFDEILQLGISDWHSTFCKSWLLVSAKIWHFVIVTWHSNPNSHPENAAPGDRCLPWLRHCLHERLISLLQVMHTANYTEVKPSYKNYHIEQVLF